VGPKGPLLAIEIVDTLSISSSSGSRRLLEGQIARITRLVTNRLKHLVVVKNNDSTHNKPFGPQIIRKIISPSLETRR
jgi:hypothetical protein